MATATGDVAPVQPGRRGRVRRAVRRRPANGPGGRTAPPLQAIRQRLLLPRLRPAEPARPAGCGDDRRRGSVDRLAGPGDRGDRGPLGHHGLPRSGGDPGGLRPSPPAGRPRLTSRGLRPRSRADTAPDTGRGAAGLHGTAHHARRAAARLSCLVRTEPATSAATGGRASAGAAGEGRCEAEPCRHTALAAVRDDPGGRHGGRWSRGAEGSSRRGLTALASLNGLRPADVHSVDKPRRVHDVLENLAAGGGNVTVDDHFELVASVYDSLRTTDEAPVRRIRELLPDGPVVGLDLGCGTGRYSWPLRGMLPDGSLLAASDVSAAMLAELKASHNGRAPVAPLRCN